VLGCTCHTSQDIYCGALFKILVIICVSVSISTSTHSMELNRSNFPFEILSSLVTFEDERSMSDVLSELIHSC
jgi:hypothetical protein